MGDALYTIRTKPLSKLDGVMISRLSVISKGKPEDPCSCNQAHLHRQSFPRPLKRGHTHMHL